MTASFALAGCGTAVEETSDAQAASRFDELAAQAGLTERFAECDRLAGVAIPGRPADVSCKLREINARQGTALFPELCRELAPGYSAVGSDGRCIYPGI